MAVICGTPTPATMRVVQMEPGPIPTLTASAPASSSAFAAAAVAMLPPITWICGNLRFTQRTRSSTPCEWPCAVSTTSTSTPASTSASARSSVPSPTPIAAPDAQPAQVVLAGVRILGGLEDVLDRDQPAQLELAVDHQHPLQTVLVHQRLRLLERGALAHGHQSLARRHDVAHRLIEIGLEAQVAVGDDADHALAFDHRQPGDLVGADQIQHLAHAHGRARW